MTTEAAPTAVELDEAAKYWLNAYKMAKERKDIAEAQLLRCREQLEAALGDAEEATVDGVTVVTWRWSKGSTRIDVKALREKDPDLAEQFTVTGAPVRKFLLADEK